MSGAVAAMVIGALLAPVSPASAEPLGCGTVITETTTLDADVGPCIGDGLVVGADHITLDLGGHRVFGPPEPGDGNQAGIRVPDRIGVTVQNGTVSGFDAGVFLQNGAGNHTITGMTLRDNLGPDTVASYLGDGIYVENSPGAHIVGNTLVNNGIFDGIGVYGVRSAGATVENNLVEDSRGPSDRSASYGQGIIANGFVDENDRGKTVLGHKILNNIVRRSDSGGISNSNHTDGAIVGNTVEDNGLNNRNGNGIAVRLGIGAPPGTRMLVEDNQIHGNGLNGIFTGEMATGNRILNNNASDNAVLGRGPLPLTDPPPLPTTDDLKGIDAPKLVREATDSDNTLENYDLHDTNVDCAGSLWLGNVWGTGGYNPPCTTTGGTGPTTTTSTTTTSTTTSTSSTTTSTTSTTVPPTTTRRPPADFDGDRDSDRSVFRNGAWYAEGQPSTFFGVSGDIPVPGDYNGDGTTDRAVYRKGAWYIQGQPTVFLGNASDIPVPGDYDGNGTTEPAVYRNGAWHIHGQPSVFLGNATDIPVPGDYDANGSTDKAVYRNGAWYVHGQATVFHGVSGDIPAPGDYDANGSTDRAVYRKGAWHVAGQPTVFLGTSGDVPVPGDYDADGSTDRAVYRNGAWYVAGQPNAFLGVRGDIPLPLPQAIYRSFL